MQHEEKAKLITLLKNSEAELFAVLETISAANFLAKPAKNQWNASEIIEHLIITDTGLLQSIIKQGEKHRDETPETMVHEKIIHLVSKREMKVNAPDYLVPKGIFTTKADAVQAFKASRAAVENFVNTTDLPLEKIAFKHFALGLLNGYNWIAFMAGHCKRHTAQMKEMAENLATQ